MNRNKGLEISIVLVYLCIFKYQVNLVNGLPGNNSYTYLVKNLNPVLSQNRHTVFKLQNSSGKLSPAKGTQLSGDLINKTISSYFQNVGLREGKQLTSVQGKYWWPFRTNACAGTGLSNAEILRCRRRRRRRRPFNQNINQLQLLQNAQQLASVGLNGGGLGGLGAGALANGLVGGPEAALASGLIQNLTPGLGNKRRLRPGGNGNTPGTRLGGFGGYFNNRYLRPPGQIIRSPGGYFDGSDIYEDRIEALLQRDRIIYNDRFDRLNRRGLRRRPTVHHYHGVTHQNTYDGEDQENLNNEDKELDFRIKIAKLERQAAGTQLLGTFAEAQGGLIPFLPNISNSLASAAVLGTNTVINSGIFSSNPSTTARPAMGGSGAGRPTNRTSTGGASRDDNEDFLLQNADLTIDEPNLNIETSSNPAISYIPFEADLPPETKINPQDNADYPTISKNADYMDYPINDLETVLRKQYKARLDTKAKNKRARPNRTKVRTRPYTNQARKRKKPTTENYDNVYDDYISEAENKNYS